MLSKRNIVVLYVAIFSRAPEGEGLDYWYNLAKEVATNTQLFSSVDSFVSSWSSFSENEKFIAMEILTEEIRSITNLDFINVKNNGKVRFSNVSFNNSEEFGGFAFYSLCFDVGVMCFLIKMS